MASILPKKLSMPMQIFTNGKKTENITTGRLVELARKWYALDDSVASCIIRDSMKAHAPARQEIIHDSLRFIWAG